MYGTKQPEISNPSKKVSIVDLFRKIEKGDNYALFDLYDLTSGLLFGLALKILGDVAEAEETLIDIYTSIWKNPVSHSADYPPLAWLVMIARAHALTRLYETRQSYVPAPTADSNGAGDNTFTNNEQKNAHARFEALAPKQREILDWAFCSGLSAEGIAAKTGATVGAVKMHVRIGLNHLNINKTQETTDTSPRQAKQRKAIAGADTDTKEVAP